jgi:NAD+ synthase
LSSDLSIDAKLEIRRVSEFIKGQVFKARASGVVVAISGGIDSTVSSYLAVRALGRKKVLGLLLFEEDSKDSLDYKDAKEIISILKIRSTDLSVSPVVKAFKESLDHAGFHAARFVMGNVKARCRMIFLYAFANENNLLVLGTGDRSEEEIGYFTKYGDGGVDLQPIAHLYKTQVRILARELGVPQRIIAKPSSPRLWKGHEAADELPVDYPSLDKILAMLFDKPKTYPDVIARKLGISTRIVRDVLMLHERNAHKRKLPPSLIEIP